MGQQIIAPLLIIGMVAPLGTQAIAAGIHRFDHIEFGSFPGGGTSAVALNQAGLVVGNSGGPSASDFDAFISDAGGRLTNLNTIGFDATTAIAINDAGQVAGIGCHLVNDGLCANSVFRYSPSGGTIEFGGLPSGSKGDVAAMNAGGDIVGSWMIDDHASVFHAFIHTDSGGMQDLGTLGGLMSGAVALNDSRQVVGLSQYGTLPAQHHAFLWQDGIMTDLGSLGGVSSAATDINNAGTVVGWALDAKWLSHAFIRTAKGGMQPLPLPEGADAGSAALAINEAGMVLISYQRSDGNSGMAIVMPEGDLIDIPLLPGFPTGSAVAMNNLGHVVGANLRVEGSAEIIAPFYWSSETGSIQLQDAIISGLPWAIFSPMAINDADQILVRGFNPESYELAALLRPALPGDVNGDRDVDVDDLFGVINGWGDCPSTGGCTADFDGNAVIDIDDLFDVINHWGS